LLLFEELAKPAGDHRAVAQCRAAQWLFAGRVEALLGMKFEGSAFAYAHKLSFDLNQASLSIQWDLVGGCKFLINGEVQKISWIEMMASLSPHEIVKRIEVAVGLGIPQATPVTTPKSLAYRVIASALATAVDDRHEWYSVPAPMTYDEEPDDPGCVYFDEFPSALEARAAYTLATERNSQRTTAASTSSNRSGRCYGTSSRLRSSTRPA